MKSGAETMLKELAQKAELSPFTDDSGMTVEKV
jgi:hypothetical protein